MDIELTRIKFTRLFMGFIFFLSKGFFLIDLNDFLFIFFNQIVVGKSFITCVKEE